MAQPRLFYVNLSILFNPVGRSLAPSGIRPSKIIQSHQVLLHDFHDVILHKRLGNIIVHPCF